MKPRYTKTARSIAAISLLSWSLIHCAGTAQTVRASSIDPLAALSRSPLATQVQRDAPEAFAEFARAVQAAEQATGDDRVAKVRDAELVLAWAATQARVRQAQARQREAQARTTADHDEQTRIDEQVARLDRESDERERAANSLQTATSPAATVAGATQAVELRQQARLALAAATLLGATEAQVSPVRALITLADNAGANVALATAGRAYTAATQMVQSARMASTESPDDAVLASVSGGEVFVDPRPDARGVVLALRGLFDTRGALAPASQGRLAVIVQSLRNHPQMRARIEAFQGGADAAVSQRAAQDRARVVREALITRGIEGSRIEAEGVARVSNGARAEDVVEVVLLSNG